MSYADHFWEVSPLNVKNNINGIGDLARADVLSLKDSRMVAVQGCDGAEDCDRVARFR